MSRVPVIEIKHEGIAEYISRPARLRLVELCISAIEAQIAAEEDRAGKKYRGPGAASILADRLNTTKRTVNRWRGKIHQAKDINAKLLLSVAQGLNMEGMRKILIEDLARHRQELHFFIALEDEEASRS